MSEKVLIIGASGLIGYSLYEHFLKDYKVLGTYNTHSFDNLIHLNLSNKTDLENILRKINPDVILLPAALTAVDYCEKNRDACWNTNVTGPNELINLIKKQDTKLVYFSTDYIFDGKNGPYSEEAEPNPLNFYGNAKLETEKNIQNNLIDYIIIRTTVVYGWEHLGKNFIFSLRESLNNGLSIKVPRDQIGTPTYVEDLAKVTYLLVSSEKKGVYNVAGPEIIDRYNFALTAANVFNLNKALIKPVTTSELKQLAERPLKAGLRIGKLLKNIKIKMRTPHEGLENMKRNKKDYAIIGRH